MSGPARIALADRFWPKVREADDRSPNGWTGCWLWTASLNGAGYGQINEGGDGRPLLAHRVAYELVVGPIPADREIDHRCRRRSCVNPAHLEPVTRAVNCRRGLKSKMTAETAAEARRLRARGWTLQAIADRYGVTNQSIDAIVKGRAWKDAA